MRSRLARILLLAFAVLPTAVVVVVAIYIWLTNNSANLRWDSKIWFIVIWQVLAIVVFVVHAGRNRRLAGGERGEWVFQIIVYIPFGMISYWKKQVWDPHYLR
jgi:predicted lysophospholipase L1 biosynthesis ABC-type transport system permease subunit